MQIHIFNISIADTGEQEAELNRFLSSHKVLEVEQRNSYQPFLPVTMRLKAGTVFITFPALSSVLTLTAVVDVFAVSVLTLTGLSTAVRSGVAPGIGATR